MLLGSLQPGERPNDYKELESTKDSDSFQADSKNRAVRQHRGQAQVPGNCTQPAFSPKPLIESTPDSLQTLNT